MPLKPCFTYNSHAITAVPYTLTAMPLQPCHTHLQPCHYSRAIHTYSHAVTVVPYTLTAVPLQSCRTHLQPHTLTHAPDLLKKVRRSVVLVGLPKLHAKQNRNGHAGSGHYCFGKLGNLIDNIPASIQHTTADVREPFGQHTGTTRQHAACSTQLQFQGGVRQLHSFRRCC